jgi:hypothetical protein
MDDRAVNQNSEATGKFSILDWPTPEMLQAANRARARAVCDMVVALGKWAKAHIASHPISRSPQDALGCDALRVDRSVETPCPYRCRMHVGQRGIRLSAKPTTFSRS